MSLKLWRQLDRRTGRLERIDCLLTQLCEQARTVSSARGGQGRGHRVNNGWDRCYVDKHAFHCVITDRINLHSNINFEKSQNSRKHRTNEKILNNKMRIDH